jgi:hypothetical protein
MKEPDKQFFDDFEHRVNMLIDHYGNAEGAPKMEDYGFSRNDLDDYLFDKQVILDMEGSPKTQYTLAGILIILPIIVFSAFPDGALPFGQWTIFAGMAIGVLLWLFVKSLLRLIINIRVKKNANEKIDKYIRDLQFFSGEKIE